MIMENKPKIYIVDDDASVCKALGRLMKSAGFAAETFSSAQNFMESIQPGAQGILILDICMPDMDGFRLQKELNALPSDLKIIFITAHAQSGDRDKAMEAGAKGFLYKPFSDKELLALIDSLTMGD